MKKSLVSIRLLILQLGKGILRLYGTDRPNELLSRFVCIAHVALQAERQLAGKLTAKDSYKRRSLLRTLGSTRSGTTKASYLAKLLGRALCMLPGMIVIMRLSLLVI